jgi:predicted dehydrogenase
MNGLCKPSYLIRGLFFCAIAVVQAQAPTAGLRLIELDPGHSHISGLHSRVLPGVSNEVHLYSPLTPELTAHLAALARYNHRAENPTAWTVRLFAAPEFLSAFRQEPPGGIVALSGRNEKKIDYIATALESGQHVFADKPWIMNVGDFPRLEAALTLAAKKRLVTYDWMTLRGNAAYQLQRDLVMDADLFGEVVPGSVEEPAAALENLHALLKYSNGVPQTRPASFLDVRQQGEGMADVGTHLTDLAEWTLFPNRQLDYRRDIKVLKADRAALPVTLEQFTRLTGEAAWPDYLKQDLVNGVLQYFSNNSCVVTIRGIHIRLKSGWQFEAPLGSQDTYFTSYQGSRARVELRAGAAQHFIPEIYVIPREAGQVADVSARLGRTVQRLNGKYPGLAVDSSGTGLRVVLPKAARGGDDLLNIFKEFAGYVRDYQTFPASENANLLAKYYITTTAVAMAQGGR